MGASSAGHRDASLSQFLFTSRSLCSPPVYFPRNPVALLATGILEQRHLCVATMFVYIPQTPPLHGGGLCWCVFGVIAVNGFCCGFCVARIVVVGFTHMVRSSRRIVEDDRGVAAEEP